MIHRSRNLLYRQLSRPGHRAGMGGSPAMRQARPSRLSRTLPRVALALAAALIAAGCETAPPPSKDRATIGDAAQRAADQEFVREPFADQARRGVVRQRALFDAHFVPDSDRLSPLGRRDVAILADALRTSGGRVALRRGPIGEQLYAARVAQVRQAFVNLGIDPSRISIDDGMPGGSGSTTEDALLIRADIRDNPMAPISDAVLQPTGAGTPQEPMP